ncbi:anaerobic benzoate catabolism transcriptional regulator [Corynebacterium afermentans subsp. afermentans]|uniref:Helix-turn-helix domain-containing protein n=1 Tax=Corynebacterium afermentans TaxID=38286 RepID=A0A9X8R3B7_9CORY|nr:helix-turn-helix domain-containing protein [Corynebacterium afermentans]RUQ13751.1 helix-turn-helix domain-containing protein [Corynebacterium genitalium]MCG7292836.1 helix-turn-helix domain-containing protein [Corynebacterium afermentans]MDC7107868.1 helix-turn-helix domain-containing protein [Corynebacterium afermentans]OAA16830.1 transcriptional regulator [Corynebacterium afermentans subsp. afermentans]WJY55893.1 anaerobic benzoate catabolism transcriptional regulator [Corynebacterium af
MSDAHHKPRNKQGKPASDDPVLIALGEQIASRRRATGRLQQDVADAAGVSRSTLHTIEHGGAGVRWEKVIAVAEALGLRMGFTEA